MERDAIWRKLVEKKYVNEWGVDDARGWEVVLTEYVFRSMLEVDGVDIFLVRKV